MKRNEKHMYLTKNDRERFRLENEIFFTEPINYDLFTENDLRFTLKAHLESGINEEKRFESIKTKDLLSTLKLTQLNKITFEFWIEDTNHKRQGKRQELVKEIRSHFSKKEFDEWFMFIGNFESLESMREWLDLT